MHKKKFKVSIITLVITIASVLLTGMLIFSMLEGWSLIDSLYFVTMTATTVGYGDLIPSTNISKIMTILFSLSIIPFVLHVFSVVAQYQMDRIYRKVNNLERKQYLQKDEIEKQEHEIEVTEKKIKLQRNYIKNQKLELEDQEKKIKKEIRINRKQGKTIDEQGDELEKFEKEVKKHSKALANV